jgi:hypothetical protein
MRGDYGAICTRKVSWHPTVNNEPMKESWEQPSGKPGFKLQDALILTLVTFTGYGVAFAFRAAFFSYYGIPLELINLDLVTGLIVAVVVLSICWGALQIAVSSNAVDLLRNDDWCHRVADYLVLTAAGASGLMLAGCNSVLISVLFISLALLGAFIRRRISAATVGKTRDHRVTPLYMLAGRFLPPQLHLLLGIVAFLLPVTYAVERVRAPLEPRYVTFDAQSSRNEILLTISGDRAMFASYSTTHIDSGMQRGRKVLETGPVIIVVPLGPSTPPLRLHELDYPRPLVQPAYIARKKGFLGWVFAYSPDI